MKTRRVILFAAGDVGANIVREVGGDEAVVAVVLHSSDPEGRNDDIRKAARTCLVWEGSLFGELRTFCAKQSPDLFVLAWWPERLSEEILRIPKVGTLNLHPSFLPWGRGKHSTFYAIKDGEPFGVTIHWAVEKLDAGDIAWQSRITVYTEDTSADLIRRARVELFAMFCNHWNDIKHGEIPRLENSILRGSYHDSTEIDEASRLRLDHCYSGRHWLNLLRARTCEPHPACWFESYGQRYEVRLTITPI